MDERGFAEELRRVLRYDATTGHLINIVQRSSNAKAGTRAGSLKRDGYRHIDIGGKRYMEHRVVWLLVHGRWPHPQIDHINRVRSDNRIANLREVTHAENMRNTIRKPRASGAPYPYVRSRGKRYYAYARSGRAQIHLGAFSCPEQAYAAHVAFIARATGEQQ